MENSFQMLQRWSEQTLVFVMLQPVLTAVLACTALLLMLSMMLSMKLQWMRKRERSRGSKMTKRQRMHWLRSHKADVVIKAFDDELHAGRITEAEYSMICRQLANDLRLPDLKTQRKWNTAEVIKPSKSTCAPGHLDTVKKSLKTRSTWKFWKFLNKPVTIPGPGPLAVVTKTEYKPKSRLFKARALAS